MVNLTEQQPKSPRQSLFSWILRIAGVNLWIYVCEVVFNLIGDLFDPEEIITLQGILLGNSKDWYSFLNARIFVLVLSLLIAIAAWALELYWRKKNDENGVVSQKSLSNMDKLIDEQTKSSNRSPLSLIFYSTIGYCLLMYFIDIVLNLMGDLIDPEKTITLQSILMGMSSDWYQFLSFRISTLLLGLILALAVWGWEQYRRRKTN